MFLAEDAGSDDPGFKDLIKYWKKHGIPIPSELLSDMADEKGKNLKTTETRDTLFEMTATSFFY